MFLKFGKSNWHPRHSSKAHRPSNLSKSRLPCERLSCQALGHPKSPSCSMAAAPAAAASAVAACMMGVKDMPPARAGRVLLYDGVCNLCNSSLHFIAKRSAAQPGVHAVGPAMIVIYKQLPVYRCYAEQGPKQECHVLLHPEQCCATLPASVRIARHTLIP